MATYTANYAFTQPTVGSQAEANLWGGMLNTDMSMVDEALGKTLQLSGLTNANVTLTYGNGQSGLQANCAHYVCTGVLSGNIIIFFPAGIGRTFSISNQTTGNFTLSVACTGFPGSALSIPQGGSIAVVSDGTNCTARVTVSAPIIGALLAANNLSDLQNKATARSNLGVSQTGADPAYCLRANNLSDVNSATARSNLGIGAVGTLGVGTGLSSGGGNLSVTYGTTAGTATQGNDSRISGALQKTSNLSDVSNANTAFNNLVGAQGLVARQQYYGTVSGGTLTTQNAIGGISVVRNSVGNYTVTLGSTSLNVGAVTFNLFGTNGLGDGLTATPTTGGPYAANAAITFNVRATSSKTLTDLSDILINAY